MTGMLISLAVVLVLAILLLIFRIQTLVKVMKGDYQDTVKPSNGYHALGLVIFMVIGFALFFWYSSVASHHYLPKAVSEHGVKTDLMFWVTMSILCFAFIVTNIFLFAFAYKYQYKKDNKALFYPDNHKLEIVWTVIPAIVMAILVFYGWKEWSEITKEAPKDAVVVEIMGKQFAWQVRYPGKDNSFGAYHFTKIDASNEFGLDFSDKSSYDDFIPSELYIPKGKPVLLRIRARDVLHSVFAPHFRLKMDAVPGMPTKFWFTPTKTTAQIREELGNPDFNYEIACTEVCGRGHFAMRFVIKVVEEAEYEEWYKTQKTFVEMNQEYVLSKATSDELKKLVMPQPNNEPPTLLIKSDSIMNISQVDSLTKKI
ncbi:MAG: cytochrome c oxidase subunit II [Cytophagales bacterium]|nr:MAG: cytochrome c oxidase subunit II [Cytophagales bacterium]